MYTLPKLLLHGWILKTNQIVKYCCFGQDAQSYAEDNGLLFMETSAKTAMNVNDIFLAIGECSWLFLCVVLLILGVG